MSITIDENNKIWADHWCVGQIYNRADQKTTPEFVLERFKVWLEKMGVSGTLEGRFYTEEEIEKIKQDSFDDGERCGYEDGRGAGYDDGYEDAKSELV